MTKEENTICFTKRELLLIMVNRNWYIDDPTLCKKVEKFLRRGYLEIGTTLMPV